jgi:hypothetical protein
MKTKKKKNAKLFCDKRHWYCPFFATLEDEACIRDNKSAW